MKKLSVLKPSKEQTLLLYRDGFLPPGNSLLKERSVRSISEKLLSHMRRRDDQPIYGRHSVRDWHLIYPELLNFVSHPKVLGQLTSILGDDIILWRSHLFYKTPGMGPVGWHQDFGTFSGEDIGNNKISLLPSHLGKTHENTLSGYLSDTIQQSVVETAPDLSKFWNITIWVALSDITEETGPIRFVAGSHKVRYPVRMSELTKSDFWRDPFIDINSREQLIQACAKSTLVLDLDTSSILKNIAYENKTYGELKSIILNGLRSMVGSKTVIDDIDKQAIQSFPMQLGDYILFSERTMHGSTGNTSKNERLAINFRITTSSTLVYPARLKGDFQDGFNLDVSKHKCVLLNGVNLNKNNNVCSIDEIQR